MDSFSKRITRKYWLELGAAIGIYTIVIFVVMPRLHTIEDLWLRALLVLTPMIPFVFAMVAIFRHVKRMDEFQRQNAFEVMSIAAAGTMFITFGYGFLELVGFPRLSMFSVWMVMGTLWIITNLIYRFRGRHHP